jgi:regulator of cell morphogenesis and NO signaling
MDILGELSSDHGRLRSQMDALEAMTSPDVELLRRFAGELLTHATLEDRLLFCELESGLPSDHGPLLVMREEHHEIESRLARIEADAAAGEIHGLRHLFAIAREHFLKEEQVLFSFAERLIEPARLENLGADLRAARAPSPLVSCDVRVAELARSRPETIRVFQRRGIDFCCGGKRGLAEACTAAGVPFDDVSRELGQALASRTDTEEDWTRRPATDLVGYILVRFHSGLRDELERLEAMALRSRDRHGAEHPELAAVAETVRELRRAMVEHLDVEEREIFPALLAGGDRPVLAKLHAAEDEHRTVGRLFATLREATSGYRPPSAACNTWRGLYHGLADLERETHLHIHLENNVLFERAAAGDAVA